MRGCHAFDLEALHPMNTAVPTPKIFGPFEVIAKIGSGGSAAVYKVRHRASGKIAALKVCPRYVLLSPEARWRTL